MSKIETAVQWQLGVAADDSKGYDQNNRWGPNYDCSSMNIEAWERAGVPVKSAGATYTGNMKRIYLANGFEDVSWSVNLHTGEGLHRGDVLLNEIHHVATYIGNGQLVHASINELGRAVGGQSGDQTGREICVRSYYNYPWNCVLRFVGDDREDGPSPQPQPASGQLENIRDGQRESIKFTGHNILVDGIYGPETKMNKIRVLQHAMNLDYKAGLVEDGKWGPKTDAALGNHYICRGETQYMVTAMEICAYMAGNDPHGVEYPGTYGPGLAAVMQGDFCSADVFRFCFALV
jgi:cell wall-associated NlpC family hydrolase